MRVLQRAKCLGTLILLISCPILAQNTAPGLDRFMQIRPFQHSRADVEGLFGKGRSETNKYVVAYTAADLSIIVSYTHSTCAESVDTGWRVPVWTAEEVMYVPQASLPSLKSFAVRRNNFRKLPSGDVKSQTEYLNEVLGVLFVYDRIRKGVISITIRPTNKELINVRCSAP